jgi:antitoxin component YwqK of YwqJK toxin-antitoxin module
MKNIILTLTLISSFTVFSQIKTVERKKCNEKETARKGQRFTDWECGKNPAAVDCNEKLELEEGNNTIFSKGTGSPFSGTCETCHSNGILERKVNFINGKEHGIDTTYYKTGCPMVIRNHISGEENGQWTFFHDTIYTMVAWEMNYFAGEKHGLHIFYDKKGDTTLLEHYKNGQLDGVKKKYYPKSKIKTIINYKKGLMDGEYINFNPDGIVIEKLNYLAGKKNGECTYFYSDGKLLSTENWVQDIKVGEFKTFFYQGNLQTLETWKKGSGKKEVYFSYDIFECESMDIANEVAERLTKKIKSNAIISELGAKSPINLVEHRLIDQNEIPYLKGKKLNRGVNQPYKYKGKFYVVMGLDRQEIVKNEIREGAFEEYFPNKKAKRIAVYKKDILIEEHVYDEFGNELSSFGGTNTKKTEDDDLPGKKKKKVKEKKKAKLVKTS